jgi:PKD repeat protein
MKRMHLTPLTVLFCILFPYSALAVTHDVSVRDNFFSPNDLTIEVGDTVRWTNAAGGARHDVTEDGGSWSSVTATSFTFERTFNTVEEVRYYCTVHSSPGQNINTRMNGRLNVIEADQGQPPTAAFNSSCTGLDCDFTDQSTDSDGAIASWSWTFGDGGNSSAQNPNHSFAAAGTYSVMLTVTDNDGDSDSVSQNVMVSEPPPDPIEINIGMSDAWFYPVTDGQGFFIIVWEGISTIFLSWFTFDTERPPEDVMAILGEPGHRWLVAQGPYEGDTALLEVFLTAGGVFDSAVPEAMDPVPYGTITIKWTSCNSAILTYDIPSLGLIDEIPIERIVPEQNVPLCEAGQNMP